MKKKHFLALLGIIAFISMYAWNPFSRSSWEDLGRAIQQTVFEPIKEKVIDPTHDAINKLKDSWEAKREYGRKLDQGAEMLKDAAPGFVQKIAPLQAMPTKLVEGRTQIEAAIANIHKTRVDLDNQLSGLDKKTEALSKLGQKKLVEEIRGGLTDLRAGLLKLADTDAQGKCNNGALCKLLGTTINNVKFGRDQINKLNNEINELGAKVNANQSGCIGDLPLRMRSTASFLKI